MLYLAPVEARESGLRTFWAASDHEFAACFGNYFTDIFARIPQSARSEPVTLTLGRIPLAASSDFGEYQSGKAAGKT